MIDTKYGILFTLELLHKFYTDQSCNDFVIKPSTQTAQILNGHKIVVKQYENQLYAGLQIDSTGKPFSVIENGMQLTFFLQLNNPLFFNYTNLPFSFPSGKIYYFTNRNDNAANGKNFLSNKIAQYSSAATYLPGFLAVNGAGTVFEAIRSSNAGSPFDLSHADHWMPLDKNMYMSESDALQWLPAVSIYNFSAPQSAANITVSGFNPATNDYTNIVLNKTIPFANPSSSFQLDLSALNAGKYKLTINGADTFIYLNDELNATSTFAVIDIFNETTLPASNKMLDNSNNLLSPLYTVYFLNRATIWKYVLASGTNGSVNDNANVFHFANNASTIFSVAPIPLNEKAKNFKLTVNAQDFSPIASATPERLVNHVQSGDTYYCSEIFLNF
jgi:hypothetical protein